MLGRYSAKGRNPERQMVVDFAKIMNICKICGEHLFPKKEHTVIYKIDELHSCEKEQFKRDLGLLDNFQKKCSKAVSNGYCKNGVRHEMKKNCNDKT